MFLNHLGRSEHSSLRRDAFTRSSRLVVHRTSLKAMQLASMSLRKQPTNVQRIDKRCLGVSPYLMLKYDRMQYDESYTAHQYLC